MFQKVLLAAALQHWDVPSPYASAAREVATQLAKGLSHPLSVLTVYTYPVLPLVQPPLIGPEIVEESARLLRAEDAALRRDVEAKLREYVQPIEHVGVAVVPMIRRGNPREEVVRVAEEIGADCLVIGAHSKRAVFDLGGTAQAICERVPAIVVMASPAQGGDARRSGRVAGGLGSCWLDGVSAERRARMRRRLTQPSACLCLGLLVTACAPLQMQEFQPAVDHRSQAEVVARWRRLSV